MSHPASPLPLGSYDTRGNVYEVAVLGNRIYLADGSSVLSVYSLPNMELTVRGEATVPNVQVTVRVKTIPDMPFTIEAASNLNQPIQWRPILTTNVSTFLFDYVDLDVRTAQWPLKFYRVRQP